MVVRSAGWWPPVRRGVPRSIWLVSWTAWPLLLDPVRADRPVRERLRTAVLLVLAYPIRLGALGAVLALIVLASTVAFIALMTISVAFAALVATRYILPAADRLDERMRPQRTAPRLIEEREN